MPEGTSADRGSVVPDIPIIRRRDGGEQRATFFELFFDLVYVFAVTQLSHHLLAAGLSWVGAAETAFMLIAVYWAWNHRSTFSSTRYRCRSQLLSGQGGPGVSGCRL